jgi:hypothetical protein
MKCFMPAWDAAFNKEHNIAGWRIGGMLPFTRHALWKKEEEDEVNSASKPDSLPSSNPTPTVIAVLESNTTLQTPSGTHPLDPSAPSPALRIKYIPDAVHKASDYMRSCDPAASGGILDREVIVMPNLRLVEAAKVIREWMGTIITEEDNEANLAKRISSRDIYGHVGSATRDEALVMLKVKEDGKEAAVAAVAAKKDQAKDKRAKDTYALVLTGSEIMTRLEPLGPSELLRRKIDELHGLLVDADSQTSIPNPNKKTRLEKANLLPTVQADIRRF